MDHSFSQRIGMQPVKSVFQVNSADADLRTSLWNDLHNKLWYQMNTNSKNKLSREIWMLYFKKPIDEVSRSLDLINFKTYFFSCEWYEVYDFIEFIVINCSDWVVDEFAKACNASLERELSTYRLIGKKFVQITSKQEIDEIEEALITSKQYTQHLDRALELFADKKTPDYRNSIKESISAVEAITKLITESPKATLGEALPLLENKLGSFHPALRKAFSNLYGYTNDAQGIRHSMLGESDLDVEDAKFMFIVCSTFINYLVAKASKVGLKFQEINKTGSQSQKPPSLLKKAKTERACFFS